VTIADSVAADSNRSPIKGKINKAFPLLIARGDIYFSDISSGIGIKFRKNANDLRRPRFKRKLTR